MTTPTTADTKLFFGESRGMGRHKIFCYVETFVHESISFFADTPFVQAPR